MGADIVTLVSAPASANGKRNMFRGSPLEMVQIMKLTIFYSLVFALLAILIYKVTKIDVYAQAYPPAASREARQQHEDDRLDEIERIQKDDHERMIRMEQRQEDSDSRINTMFGWVVGFGAALAVLGSLGFIVRIRGVAKNGGGSGHI